MEPRRAGPCKPRPGSIGLLAAAGGDAAPAHQDPLLQRDHRQLLRLRELLLVQHRDPVGGPHPGAGCALCPGRGLPAGEQHSLAPPGKKPGLFQRQVGTSLRAALCVSLFPMCCSYLRIKAPVPFERELFICSNLLVPKCMHY